MKQNARFVTKLETGALSCDWIVALIDGVQQISTTRSAPGLKWTVCLSPTLPRLISAEEPVISGPTPVLKVLKDQ